MIFGIFIGSEINKDKHIVQANESISFEEQTTEEPLAVRTVDKTQ